MSSISGGTDVVTAFAGGTAGIPAIAGELTTRYLGVALHSWSPQRRPLVGEVGEMVITTPMPSMPIGFWNDEDGSRYRAAYFDHHWADGPAPSVWRHGDWVTVTERGSLIIHGRSDATLNRHGIRMGSADIYEVVEAIDAVTEAFVLGIDGPDGAYWMPLFVTLADGHQLDDTLVDTIRSDQDQAVPAPCARRRHRRAGHPAHPHRQETGGAGHRDHGRAQRRVAGPALDRQPGPHRLVRRAGPAALVVSYCPGNPERITALVSAAACRSSLALA